MFSGPLHVQLARARQEARAIRRRLNDLREALRAQERRIALRDQDAASLLGDTTEEEIASLKTRIEEAELALVMSKQSIQTQERQIRHLSSDISALMEEWMVQHIAAMPGEDASPPVRRSAGGAKWPTITLIERSENSGRCREPIRGSATTRRSRSYLPTWDCPHLLTVAPAGNVTGAGSFYW